MLLSPIPRCKSVRVAPHSRLFSFIAVSPAPYRSRLVSGYKAVKNVTPPKSFSDLLETILGAVAFLTNYSGLFWDSTYFLSVSTVTPPHDAIKYEPFQRTSF